MYRTIISIIIIFIIIIKKLKIIIKKQEMFVKHYAPLKKICEMFCTTRLVSSKYVAQMYEEEIHFGKLLLKEIV